MHSEKDIFQGSLNTIVLLPNLQNLLTLNLDVFIVILNLFLARAALRTFFFITESFFIRFWSHQVYIFFFALPNNYFGSLASNCSQNSQIMEERKKMIFFMNQIVRSLRDLLFKSFL